MISEERKGINSRFIEAYKDLVAKNVIKPNGHKRQGCVNISAVALYVLGHSSRGHMISNFLNSQRYISRQQALKFCDRFELNSEYIINGIGSLISSQPDKNIYHASVHEMAYGPNRNPGQYFNFPGLKGALFAVTMQNDSMSPKIKEGDMIIMKRAYEIIDNEIYGVATEGYFWISRARKLGPDIVKFFPENHLEYDAVEASLIGARIYKLTSIIESL